MQYGILIIGQSWSIVQRPFLSTLFFTFMVGVGLLCFASSLHAAGEYLPKRYTLRGDLGLTYEKKWTEQTDLDLTRFTHSYNLGLSGYVVDPRLITFDVDTNFNEEVNDPGENNDSYGFHTSLNFLNRPARRGFFSHFPRPIILNFAYYNSDVTEIYNYGISFGYDLFERRRVHRQFQQQQQQQQFRKQQRIIQQTNQNDGQESNDNAGQQKQGPVQRQINSQIKTRILPLPLPVIYLDYNKNSYSFSLPSNSFKVDTDFLNLRLQDQYMKTEYRAEYDYNRYKGIANITTQYLNIFVNYRDYWAQKNERFESFNRLSLSDDGDSRALNLSNNNIWGKSLGSNLRDHLTVAGGGSYFTSDLESSPTNYDLKARSEYTKNFIKIWNRSAAEAIYGDSGMDTIYSVSLFNETNYDLSKLLSLNGRVNAGQNELGDEYGAGAGLMVRTFINISPYYDFNRGSDSEGRTTTHRFKLDMNGRIYRTMTFNSRNVYKTRKVSGSKPFEEKVLDLRGDIFWILRRMNINFGATRIAATKSESELPDGEESVDFDVTSIYSNISAPLFRNAFLTLNSTYTKNQEETFSIRPIINWHARQVTFTAEYELRRTSGESDITDHRILLRFTRTFAKGLRNPW